MLGFGNGTSFKESGFKNKSSFSPLSVGEKEYQQYSQEAKNQANKRNQQNNNKSNIEPIKADDLGSDMIGALAILVILGLLFL